MNKVLTVAKNEYIVAVASKAFILGVIMMPLMMGGVFVVQYFTKDQVDVSERRIAIVDQTGKLFTHLEAAAANRNENAIYEGNGAEREQVKPEFVVEEATELANVTDSQRIDVALSQRVRDGELFAFAIIEKGVFDVNQGSTIRYYSETPSYTSLSRWLDNTVNEEVKRIRSLDLGLSAENVRALSADAPVRHFGLVKTDSEGEVIEAKEENRILTFGVPVVGLMLMFMMLMSVAPAMLNNVLEEKMQKISEFLISSITPFQLMMGKLLGAVAVGLTLSSIYLGAAYGMAVYFEIADQIPVSIYAWFVFFLFFALIIFGSLFSAVGAACSEIKDAQSLMTPLMLMVILPMMCFSAILDSPSSVFSKAISLFPPATPMLMFLRISIPPGPEVWEIALGAILTVLFAIVCVWAAGKIFRVGILSQGQAPTLAKLIGWLIAK